MEALNLLKNEIILICSFFTLDSLPWDVKDILTDYPWRSHAGFKCPNWSKRFHVRVPEENSLPLLLLLVKHLRFQHGKYRKKLLFQVSVKWRPEKNG